MRWLTRPPGRLFYSLWALALALVLNEASVPAKRLGLISIAAFPTLGLLAVWLLRGLLRVNSTASDDADANQRGSWWLAPLSLVVVLLLASTSLPLQARFILSRPTLEAVAEDAAASRVDRSGVMGLFLIDEVEIYGTAVVFTEATGGFIFDRGGFAYIPDDPNDSVLDEVAPRCVMWPLGGDWYAWHGSWFGGSSLRGCGLDGPSRP